MRRPPPRDDMVQTWFKHVDYVISKVPNRVRSPEGLADD
jgi:hypothetical protein